jgi:histidinol phosphatase-like enzyme
LTLHPAIFLDRDGTIIEDKGYIDNTSNVKFFHYTFEALELLQNHFLLFIITNQSGISQGLISETAVQEVNRFISNNF